MKSSAYIDWSCDRCGIVERKLYTGTDTEPAGWRLLSGDGRYQRLNLCGGCGNHIEADIARRRREIATNKGAIPPHAQTTGEEVV